MRLFKNEADNYCFEFKGNEVHEFLHSIGFAIGALYNSRLADYSTHVKNLLKVNEALRESNK